MCTNEKEGKKRLYAFDSRKRQREREREGGGRERGERERERKKSRIEKMSEFF